ncbi:MAG: hypothetical protein M1820_010166 [Bogoriella megaspora]|nr:MAG: hypothetical protein M1820_010166 [Bogoriella megaspora]
MPNYKLPAQAQTAEDMFREIEERARSTQKTASRVEDINRRREERFLAVQAATDATRDNRRLSRDMSRDIKRIRALELPDSDDEEPLAKRSKQKDAIGALPGRDSLSRDRAKDRDGPLEDDQRLGQQRERSGSAELLPPEGSSYLYGDMAEGTNRSSKDDRPQSERPERSYSVKLLPAEGSFYFIRNDAKDSKSSLRSGKQKREVQTSPEPSFNSGVENDVSESVSSKNGQQVVTNSGGPDDCTENALEAKAIELDKDGEGSRFKSRCNVGEDATGRAKQYPWFQEFLDSHTAELESGRRKIEHYETKQREIIKAKQEAMKKVVSLQVRHDELEKQLENTKEETDRLTHDTIVQQELIHKQQAEISEMNANTRQLREDLVDADDIDAGLRATVERLKGEIVKHEQTIAELNTKLQDDPSVISKMEADLVDSRKGAQSLQAQLNSLRTDQHRSEVDFAQRTAEAENQFQHTNDRLEMTEAALRDTRQELDSLQHGGVRPSGGGSSDVLEGGFFHDGDLIDDVSLQGSAAFAHVGRIWNSDI